MVDLKPVDTRTKSSDLVKEIHDLAKLIRESYPSELSQKILAVADGLYDTFFTASSQAVPLKGVSVLTEELKNCLESAEENEFSDNFLFVELKTTFQKFAEI